MQKKMRIRRNENFTSPMRSVWQPRSRPTTEGQLREAQHASSEEGLKVVKHTAYSNKCSAGRETKA